MLAACLLVEHTPLYPHGQTKLIWAIQLFLLMGVGMFVVLGLL